MLFKLFFIGGLIYLLYRVSMNPSLKEPQTEEEDTIVIKKKSKKVSEDDYTDYEEVD